MVHTDTMHVIHARAAGLDVHKMQIAATVRLARPGADAQMHTRTFSALPSGLGALSDWLLEHRVSAAVMEATGIYWEAPYDALERAGIEVLLVHAQHVNQINGRKTDIGDSGWLARICQFGLCSASLVPPPHFQALRKVSRLRRQVVRERARMRNRIHKILDVAGVPWAASSPTCSAPTDCVSWRAWPRSGSSSGCRITCAPISSRCATRSRSN